MKIIKYLISIELVSDMCCGTGEGNGSTIDCLTAFDEIGLPYIPAKRLKGLLRAQAEFLCKYGAATEKDIFDLFGYVNGKRGAIRVNNAVLENFEILKSELIGCAEKSEVVDAYCSVRAQTSIDDDGIAKKGSLRLIQVVNKGNSFYSNIYLNNANENIENLLENCVKTLRHIGMNKTRGFGEVKCSLTKISEIKVSPMSFDVDSSQTTMTYNIDLLDDVVISGGANSSKDYISGSMVQGAFARYVKDFKGFDLFIKNVIFSDAYIDGLVPVPFSYVSIKNRPEKVFSLADGYEKDSKEQYVPVPGYFKIENGKFIKNAVETAVQYHYSNKTHDIFTYKKILKGQKFSGTIIAPQSYINVLQSVLEQNNGILFLGASSCAQYSTCRFSFGEEQYDKTIKVQNIMIAELLTDAVIRDEYGAISSNAKDLANAFKELFDFKEFEIYIKTITGGGFNNKWGLPIPQYTAFSRGSAIVFKECTAKSDKEIQEKGYFKDITFGGYGQYKIRLVSEKNEFDVVEFENETKICDKKSNVVREILNKIENNRNIALVEAKAIEFAAVCDIKGLSSSAAMRAYSLFLKNKTASEFENAAEINFKTNELLRKFSKELIDTYNGLKLPKTNELFEAFAMSYLTQIKRRYQQGGIEE